MSKAEGFAQIPTWMLRDRTVSRRACLVYASLSSRSGLGAIFPSQATIAEEAGVSERTVRSALQELEALGVVERISRRGKEGRATGLTNAYVLRPNGHYEQPAESAGRLKGPAKGPATSDKGTGNEQHPPLIEADIEEVDRGIVSPDESDDGTLLPDDWRPNQSHVDKAGSLQLDVRREYHRFRDHAHRTHRRLKNWNAGFTNWLRKQAEFAQQRAGSPPTVRTFAQQKQDNMLDLVGRIQEEERHAQVGSREAAGVLSLDRGA